LIKIIKQYIKNAKYNGIVYVVGGFVRYNILRKNNNDIDLLIKRENGNIEFAKWFCKLNNIYKQNSNPVIFPRYVTTKFRFNVIRINQKFYMQLL
jgi:tRNA nucleotidyltransferase/poly(A) polymerase